MMACVLDIQSLPSLEKFDSQLLDRLLRCAPDDGHLPDVMDEASAPDTEAALQFLMSGYTACFDGKQMPNAAPPAGASEVRHSRAWMDGHRIVRKGRGHAQLYSRVDIEDQRTSVCAGRTSNIPGGLHSFKQT